MSNTLRKHSFTLIVILIGLWAYSTSDNSSALAYITPVVILLICDLLVKRYNLYAQKWFNFIFTYFLIDLVIIGCLNFSQSILIAVFIVYSTWFKFLIISILLYELIHKIFLTQYSKKIQLSYLVGVPVLVVIALYINATRTW